MLKLSLRAHPGLQLGRLILLAVLALLAAVTGVPAVTHAQISPYPVGVTMTGPATAVSGQEITYLVQYRLTDTDTIPGTSIIINIPQNTAFVSSEVVSGPAGTFVGETDSFVRWADLGSAEETEGEVALTVRIGDTFVGLVHGRCNIPGTETFNPEFQCSLETQVFAPGTLPEAENACGGPREPSELAILGETNPPVDHGTVRIPELDLTSEIMDGCFEFRNLTLPQDPMLVSFEIRVDGYRPTTWANFIVLTAGSSPIFTPRLEPGDMPELIDPCPDLLSTPQEDLSAAGHLQAQLCAQLAATGTLPETGGSGPVAGSGLPLTPELLALVGAALILAGTATRHIRRKG